MNNIQALQDRKFYKAGIGAPPDPIENKQVLQNYYLYYGLLGELFIQLNNTDSAIANLLKAEELTQSQHEKTFLKEKIVNLQRSN